MRCVKEKLALFLREYKKESSYFVISSSHFVISLRYNVRTCTGLETVQVRKILAIKRVFSQIKLDIVCFEMNSVSFLRVGSVDQFKQCNSTQFVYNIINGLTSLRAETAKKKK